MMMKGIQMGNKICIGLVDADLLDNGTRHPNLAQMKISAYCKKKEYDVKLLYSLDDFKNLEKLNFIIISKVFTYSRIPNELNVFITLPLVEYNLCIKDQIDKYRELEKKETVILIGGTGFFCDGGINLHPEIEHIMPDYNLYSDYIKWMISSGKDSAYYRDYCEYSIGFITRGCFRKCDFCVNKKYNNVFLNSPISEFLDDDRPKIYLWDDNFFAFFNGWEEILDGLIKTKKPFQFRQGLDIRLLNESKAKKLSECKYCGDYIFAFDHIEDKDIIVEKLKLWKLFCKKTTKIYILCAFDPQDKWDGIEDFLLLELDDIISTFERIKILMTYGCIPYVMRYDFYKKSNFYGMYVQIARWCNQPRFFKKMSFREFCEANQKYHKTKNTVCAAYSVMTNFESTYPDLSKKYFDIKYEDLNLYKKI